MVILMYYNGKFLVFLWFYQERPRFYFLMEGKLL